MKILVTGAAGFIGNFVAERLCHDGHEVIGLDNLNDYYDPQLKLDRLKRVEHLESFRFIKMDLADQVGVAKLFVEEKFQLVIHLAAQAGVRYSLENPMAYIDSNIVGTMTILEGCRHNNVEHLVYASSSSVYGMNKKTPFSEGDRVDSPVSLYAATKKSNELMAHTYSHLYGIRTTGLRFFTVYGPWGRPDMAYFKFADAIRGGKSIDIYNNGNMERDFTYIDDIVDGVAAVATNKVNRERRIIPHYVYNLGNSRPEHLLDMVDILEKNLGLKAHRNYLPMQPGDVHSTFSDVSTAHADFGYSPSTTLEKGLEAFSIWYKSFYSA